MFYKLNENESFKNERNIEFFIKFDENKMKINKIKTKHQKLPQKVN